MDTPGDVPTHHDRRRSKECRWTAANLALLDADPLLASTFELGASARVQEILAAHGGSVTHMFEHMAESERAELTRAMTALRARHTQQPALRGAACPT